MGCVVLGLLLFSLFSQIECSVLLGFWCGDMLHLPVENSGIQPVGDPH